MADFRLFVTGATGLLGSAVARSAQRRGWTVVGLARSDVAVQALGRAGILPVRGDLRDPNGLKDLAAQADAVAHTAFMHGDGSDFAQAIAIEQAAVPALLEGANGRPIAYTSGTTVLGDTGSEPADESRSLAPPSFIAWRVAIENEVLAGGGTVFRPGLVYGHAGSGVLNGMIAMARAQGAAFYIGDGANRWSTVHADDLGEAYALGIERRATGAFHLGAEDVSMRELGEAIGRLIGKPEATRSIPVDVARTKIPFADGIVLNQRVESGRARRDLGWTPDGPGLLQDLEFGSYRAAAGAE